jgi:hypothetical protein
MPSSPKKTGTRTVSATAKKIPAKPISTKGRNTAAVAREKAAAVKRATAKRAESNEKAVPKKAGPKPKAGQLTNQKGGRNKTLARREEQRGKDVAKFGEKKVRSVEKSDSDIKWGYYDNPERYIPWQANRFPEDKTSRLKLSPSSPARIAKNSSMRLDETKRRNNWYTDTPAQTLWRAGKSSEKLDAQKAASKKATPKKAAPKKAAPKKPIPKATRSSSNPNRPSTKKPIPRATRSSKRR